MPRKRSRKSGTAGGGQSGTGRAKEAAKVAKPQGAREAAREERREAQTRQASGEESEQRNLPARRRETGPRGGYVRGIANPCRSCGFAVWVTGKDGRGKWIKVNLDGSPHVCGIPTMAGLGMGLGYGPAIYGTPAQPMLPAGSPTPIAAPPFPSPALASHPLQGPASVDRFMFYVSLALVIGLAWSPWSSRPAKESSPPPEQAGRPAAVQRAVASSPLGVPAAAAGAPAPAQKKEYFSLGSTKDDVLALMGHPRDNDPTGNRWWYGSSYVDFSEGRVVNYHNSLLGELKVQKTPSAAKNRPAYLARGLTSEEVKLLQGEPDRRDQTLNRWYYGSSYVDFRNDRVSDHFNGVLKELKVSDRR